MDASTIATIVIIACEIAAFLIGIDVGKTLERRKKRRFDGYLEVDLSDEATDRYRLVIDYDILLNIEKKNDLHLDIIKNSKIKSINSQDQQSL